MRMQRALIVVPIALGLFVAACGDDDEDTSESLPAAGPVELDGTTWVDGTAEGYDLAAPLNMSFQDGTVSITGGCNILNGAYTVEGDTLTAGPFAMTQMACDQPLMDQDTWIAGVMEAGVTVAVDGSTATLTGSDVTITLTDRASLPATPLEGTRWELESVITNDAATSFGAMASLTITEGTAAVETGCNTGSGGVEATDTSLTWGAIALTLKACEGPGADLEAIVVQVLQGETPYVIDVDQLSITSTDGATTLVYRAAA